MTMSTTDVDDAAPPVAEAPLLGFYETALRYPERLAFVGPDGDQLSFGELGARVNRISRALRARGLAHGDVVAVIAYNSAEYVEVLLATQQVGLRMVPINTRLAPAEVAYIVEDCGAQFLIAHADLAEKLASHAAALPANRYCIGGEANGWSRYESLGHGYSPSPPEDRTSGMVMGYTSGTTGRPKGVKRPMPDITPEAAAQALTAFWRQALNFRPNDGVHLVCSPLYHSAPNGFAFCALHLGHTVVCHDHFDAEAVLRDIERHKVTTTHMVPTHLQRMLWLPDYVRSRYDLSSLETLVHAGAPCPVEVKKQMIDWVGPILWEYLGATEGLVSVVSPQEWMAKPGTVGRPLPHLVLQVLDDESNEVAAGEAGLIYFSTPGRAFEYHNDPAKTAANRKGDLVTSGDYGYLDEDGYLFMLDRRDDLILSGGVNIYPAEIEHFLIGHPAVDDIAVIGVPDEEWGQSVLAVVKPSPDAVVGDELAQDIIDYSVTGLARFKRPRAVQFRDDFPRTESGKLQRRILREHYSAQADSRN
jgi:long-chain acyl-CoA synthetase